MDDGALRRGSTVLRQLLVQNELQRVWKAAGFEREPQIKASSLASILNQFPKEKRHFAAAGGAHYKGAELRGALVLNYALNTSTITKLISSYYAAAILTCGTRSETGRSTLRCEYSGLIFP